MYKNSTVEKVVDLVNPVIQDMGFELFDVELVKEGAYFYLRVYIDKEGGVTIDECSDVSRVLDKMIDDKGITKHDFFEVSSPGVERPLKKDKDFDRYKGSDVCVSLFVARDAKKKFEGKLIGKEQDDIIIEYQDEVLKFNKKEVSMVKTILKF